MNRNEFSDSSLVTMITPSTLFLASGPLLSLYYSGLLGIRGFPLESWSLEDLHKGGPISH